MQKKLISSIFIDPSKGQEQTAHALTANITTRQGYDLNIVAIAQKKSGSYSPIDTPRKTLLSFITSLQNGTGTSVEQIIFKGVNAVTVSTSAYTKRRGAAPCGLTAGVMYNDQLFSFQIGAGEIIYHHEKGMHLLTRSAANKGTRPVWLGEVRELSVQDINLQKVKLQPDSTIVVCRAHFIRSIVSKGNLFKQAVTQLAADPKNLATDIAYWAAQNGIEEKLTMAVQYWAPADPAAEMLVDPNVTRTIEIPPHLLVQAPPPGTKAPEPVEQQAEEPAVADEVVESSAEAEMQEQSPAVENLASTVDKAPAEPAILIEELEETVEPQPEPILDQEPVVNQTEDIQLDDADEITEEPAPVVAYAETTVEFEETDQPDPIAQANQVVNDYVQEIAEPDSVLGEADGARNDEFIKPTYQEVREQLDAVTSADPVEAPPEVDLNPYEQEVEPPELSQNEPPRIILPAKTLEVDLVDAPNGALSDADFGDLDDLDEYDTQRMEPVVNEPQAPERMNGFHKPAPAPATNGYAAGAEHSATIVQERPNPATDIKDRSRAIRFSLIGVAALFVVLVGAGTFLAMQRIIFSPQPDNQPAAVSAETLNTSEGNDASALAPVVEEEVGPEVGVFSQGSSDIEYSIYQGSGLDARGLIHFSLGDSANQDGTGNKKNIFAWAGSNFDFENQSPGASFGVGENSTLFLDSREGTLRPEISRLFGTAESSAGCMSINHRSVEDPLVMSCYSGTCRWRGPLNRNFDIPPGQRLSILANSRTEDGVIFEPIYRTEATVFAKTLAVSEDGSELANQCIEPYIAENRQLTVEETTEIAAGISNLSNTEIGYAVQGISNSRRLIDIGDTVSIRGLSKLTVGTLDNSDERDPYAVYAWPGSAIHFNPNLDNDQFEMYENSVIFLNSESTTIRPYIPDIFGTVESRDGCMAVNYQTADQPVVMSCFSGRCQWNGALGREYRIPVGQRLSIPSNPRSESEVVFEPIYTTEASVFARTLGSIPEGRDLSNSCVEQFIEIRDVQVIAPNEEEEPTPTPEPVEAEDETTGEAGSETEAVETLVPLGDEEGEAGAEDTPTLEAESSDG